MTSPQADTGHVFPRVQPAIAVYGLAVFVSLAVLSPVVTGGYGIFVDEFYYSACAKRLQWGYVDHPPLAPALLWLSQAFFGKSLLAFRLFPALCAGLSIVLCGRLAQQLGGGRYAQGLAALSAAAAPVYLVVFGFFSMNGFSVALWALAFLVSIEIERRDEPRLWLAFGALAGIALLNKHTFVLLTLGLLAGMLSTPARRHLRSPWLWLGALVAALIVLPNVLWQIDHGLPSLEFYQNADRLKNRPTPPHAVLSAQILAANPATLPVWGAGLFFLLASPRGRRFRHLGFIFPVLLLLLVIGQKSRPDRIAPCYTLLFAAGAVQLEMTLSRKSRIGWRRALPALLSAGALALAPLSIPLLPIEAAGRYARALGAPQIEKKHGGVAPQWFADRLAWRHYTADVRAVVDRLTATERPKAVIVATSFGLAGSLEYYGEDLPPVYSGHNTYHLWGPPPDDTEVFIIVDAPREALVDAFDEVQSAGSSQCEQCMGWRKRVPIWIARSPKRPIAQLWRKFRLYR